MKLPALPDHPGTDGPVVLCILDGVGLGDHGAGDAVWRARTPTLDRLMAEHPFASIRAHGRAVGLPTDKDMGNSEVGHNALGAGRVFDQGAKLVDIAIGDGTAFGETWRWLTGEGTLHLLGLVSDGNVHSHIDHILALIARADRDGINRLRVHVLTDGRDVAERSAPVFVRRLEEALASTGRDYRIASGGGRMRITMDRYEAEWDMVQRGWDCHVRGVGRRFPSAAVAIETLYAEDPETNDQWLGAFVIEEEGEPVGRIEGGDGVLLFNFRGDRGIEISRAFEGRAPIDTAGGPEVRFAGMMEYDGDDKVPRRYLVAPPAIDRTVGEHLAANGRRSFAISETQKFGHVTYFFNGNRSGLLDPELEQYVEIPSDVIPFDQAPEMKARAITARAVEAIRGDWDHLRLNLANGDMVGHTGDLPATIAAVEVVDECVASLEAAVRERGGVLIVTADHGNADHMLQADGSPRTAHSLNPVPYIIVDPRDRWRIAELPCPGLANAGTALLALCGLEPPSDFEPSLVRPA
ncbi:MAG TPA: 2,3-bisphosphoglycerate-independent phosphoglycerate mutase [Myxococcota bacterium]|nr:2,3-bisphosphoglycerate-independent phosphoglycerate mutase [Myxococcota bacterium]